jgi:hypothetical protein
MQFVITILRQFKMVWPVRTLLISVLFALLLYFCHGSHRELVSRKARNEIILNFNLHLIVRNPFLNLKHLKLGTSLQSYKFS